MPVQLNIDLGEHPDEAEELYVLATSANVACGGHAGDAVTMARAVGLCAKFGTALTAHPSYPDREGFGRRPMSLSLDELRVSLQQQLAQLLECARAVGLPVTAIKPHGALYHTVSVDHDVANELVEVAVFVCGSVALVGAPGGALEATARAHGLRFLREAFSDRGYRPDGTLVPRGEPGALLDEPAAAARQGLALARSGRFESLCVHGDGPRAVDVARAVRSALLVEGLLETGARVPS